MKQGKICNNIKELRSAAGITQAALADEVGATRQTIIAIEQEKYAPTLDLAFRIARAFNVPFEAVFSYED